MSMSKEIPQELIEESFQEALEKGEVTDQMGNPVEIEEHEVLFQGFETTDEREKIATRMMSHYSHLQGDVLTIIDATFTDENRIKYVKDLIKNAFSSQSNWSFEYILDFIKFEEEVE